MRFERRESRPGPEAAIPQQTRPYVSLDDTASAPLASRARRRDHGIRVVFERADHVVCSQVFATIESAERKVGKVRERGLRAEMQLVRIVPVGLELDMATVPSSVVDLLTGGDSR